MFSSVSWLEFIEFILAVLFFYYATVLLLFYRLELFRVITKFTSLKKDELLLENNAETIVTAKNKELNNSYSLTSRLTQEVQDKTGISDIDLSNIYMDLEEAIVLAKEEKYVRKELLSSLQFIIRKCTYCRGTDLSKTVNLQIQSHLAINSIDVLNSDELSQIWSN